MCDMRTRIEKLNGQEKWANWSRQIKLYLMSQDCLHVIQGGIKEEDAADEEKTGEFMKKDSLAQLVLLTHLDDKHCDIVSSCESAHDIWTKLTKTYEQSNCQKLDRLLELFFNFKSVSSITEMFAALQKLFLEINRELKDLCNVQLPELILMSRIMSLLGPDYFEFKSVWESVDPKDRSVDKLLERLNLIEMRISEKTEKSEVSALLTCWGCNKTGHKKQDCPKKNRGPKKRQENRPRGSQQNGGRQTGCDKNDARVSLYCNVEEGFAFNIRNNAVGFHRGNAWILDSGASSHMTPNREFFSDYELYSGPSVTMANGKVAPIVGIGSVKLLSNSKFSSVRHITLNNVFHVPDLAANLLAVSVISQQKMYVTFREKYAVINDGNKTTVATAQKCGNIYVLDAHFDNNTVKNEYSGKVKLDINTNNKVYCSQSQLLWHRRLCHLGFENMRRLRKMAYGLRFPDQMEREKCTACIQGKMTRLPAPKSTTTRATRKLEIVHSDLCGPFPPSNNGARYALTFTDDLTRETFAYFLKQKSETFKMFQIFKSMAENQVKEKITTLRTDNGGEFISNEMKEFLKKCGIRHELSAPYCQFQNGVAERGWLTLVQKTRCLLYHSKLGNSFWAEALNTAVYMKNRSPTVAVTGAVPHELWTGRKVSLRHLRVFGCEAFVHKKGHLSKLDQRCDRYTFVGYSDECKAYRLIDLNNPTRLITSRDVIFNENVFPAAMSTDSDDSYSLVLPSITMSNSTGSTSQKDRPSEHKPGATRSRSPSPKQPAATSQSPIQDVSSGGEDDAEYDELPSDMTMYQPSQESIIDAEKGAEKSSYNLRQRQVPKFDNLLNLSLVAIDDENITVSDALNDEKWHKAMSDEIAAMQTNDVWELVDLPEGRKPIQSRWVFKIKRDTSGKIQKYKARLVAKGYSQTPGIDYDDTYAPVVKYSTVRMLLAIAAHKNLLIHHMDVDNAFLYSENSHELYMKQPEGFVNAGNEKKVCKLKKCIYGLKQSSRQWNLKLKNVLIQMGYEQSKAEPCLFKNGVSTILCFVDDILIFESNKNRLNKIKSYLQDQFTMKDLGEVKDLLGMRISRDDNNIYIDQKTYINQILNKFQMQDCNPVKTPMEPGIILDKPARNEEISNVPYMQLIGCLTYLSICTRMDIANSVSRLAQFNNSHSLLHWNAAKRILRYLKGTSDMKLAYPVSCENKTEFTLSAYADSDFSNNLLDRKSFTGYVVKLGNAPISWESKKQSTVALSTAEAEYMALAESAKEVKFENLVFTEIMQIENSAVEIFSDSQSAISLTKNELVNRKTKHIDIRYHFIRQLVMTNEIRISHVAGDENIADIMTKPLPLQKHQYCVNQLLHMKLD